MRKECVIVKLDQHMRGLYAGFLLEQYDNGVGTMQGNIVGAVPDILIDNQLYAYMKKWSDAGYGIRCIDQSKVESTTNWYEPLKKAIRNPKGLAVRIWRYLVSSPFAFGCSRKPMKTEVRLYDYKIVMLHGGWPAIVIKEGSAKGVYELTSGGMVGDTVEQVNADIDACGDMELMASQVAEAGQIRDTKAVLVLTSDFGID